MMQRKLLSLVLAFAMTAGLLTVGAGAAGPAYGDTVGHWAEGSIGRWIEHGIVQGSNGAFAPNAPIARERAMVILGRAMGIEPIENPDWGCGRNLGLNKSKEASHVHIRTKNYGGKALSEIWP